MRVDGGGGHKGSGKELWQLRLPAGGGQAPLLKCTCEMYMKRTLGEMYI